MNDEERHLTGHILMSYFTADFDLMTFSSSFQLERQLEPIRYKQQNGHFNLVSLYSESLSELSNYKGFIEFLFLCLNLASLLIK